MHSGCDESIFADGAAVVGGRQGPLQVGESFALADPSAGATVDSHRTDDDEVHLDIEQTSL